MVTFKFSKSLYPKSVLLKSAYAFTDRAYLHLDADESYYYVNIEYKEGQVFEYKDFENEMLTQAVRHEVLLQTKDLRTLVVARALSSTMIGQTPDDTDSEEEEIDVDALLTSWFDKNG